MPIKDKIPRPIKRVLIALDYEKSATKVASGGYSLAHALGAEVVLLHVINDPIYYTNTEYSPITGFGGLDPGGFTETLSEKDLKKASNYFLERIKNHLGDEGIIDIITEEGDFPDAILKVAERVKADLLVMGSHSRRGLEKILIGSVTEKVLNSSSIPMYIIPVKDI